MLAKKLPAVIIRPATGKPGREPMDLDLARIENLAHADLNKKEIAIQLGIEPKYWFKLAKDYPEIDQAFSIGRTKKKKKVLDKLDEKIEEGDLKAVTYWLDRMGGEDFKPQKNDVNIIMPVSKEHRLAAIESARQAMTVDATYKDITPEEWDV